MEPPLLSPPEVPDVALGLTMMTVVKVATVPSEEVIRTHAVDRDERRGRERAADGQPESWGHARGHGGLRGGLGKGAVRWRRAELRLPERKYPSCRVKADETRKTVHLTHWHNPDDPA